MLFAPPTAHGEPPARADLRVRPEDFFVEEIAGYPLSGSGEHAYLLIEKRELNTTDVVRQLAAVADVPRRDIGFAGMKDRRAVTRQWFSVGLAGKPDPNWAVLEQASNIRVLSVDRHLRKLRRGNHRGNRFRLILRNLQGDRAALEHRLSTVRSQGAPNYFGQQRFGRGGTTLQAALRWVQSGHRVSRDKRGLYLSALRAQLFNHLLSERVLSQRWNKLEAGGVCMLAGSASFFACEQVDDALLNRLDSADIHPGLPLWGQYQQASAPPVLASHTALLADHKAQAQFLIDAKLELAWRATRLMPDDFSWEFCDDGRLQLDFALGAGSYATALLGECVHYKDVGVRGESSSEPG